MIERAIILKIQKEQPNVQLFIKLILMINRIYYPQMIAITVFSSTLLLFLNVSIYYYVYIFLLMQTIFISIAWHECIHISFARFLSYEPIFVSFLPYTFGARTHFECSRKIENLDKAGILLAAPIILTIIGFISLWISIKWIHSFASIIFICAFLLINILSLLPNKKCDGGRAYEIFKKMGRVACETAITTGLVVVMGEITTRAYIDISQIVRNTISEIGYDDIQYGFDAKTCCILTCINGQSNDIAIGVDKAFELKKADNISNKIESIGAGDQGMMFGFATNETKEFMPYPIVLAHKLAQQLTKVRKDKILPYLRPDGKTQVTIEYDEEQKPIRIEAVVLSTQHDSVVTQKQIHTDIKKYVFDPILPIEMVDENTKYFINPTGRFVVGGPNGDSGLTGRKIIVDTYGGYARHGGGAFSGKDCTKVDRSAAYAARYIAKNIVAAGLAEKCEIQLSYAIGVARPMSIMVDTFGTSKLSDSVLSEIICRHFDLRPTGIIKMLNLRQPIYKQTSAYGHFGRDDLDLSWEKTDKIEVLKEDYNSIISKGTCGHEWQTSVKARSNGEKCPISAIMDCRKARMHLSFCAKN